MLANNLGSRYEEKYKLTFPMRKCLGEQSCDLHEIHIYYPIHTGHTELVRRPLPGLQLLYGYSGWSYPHNTSLARVTPC